MDTKKFRAQHSVLSEIDLSLLGPGERRAADYIARHPEEAERSTITELASAIPVSPSTLSKLCRTLGFADFKSFRLELARANTRLHMLPPEPSDHSLAGRLHRSMAASVRVLNRTEAELDLTGLSAAVDAIAKADRILFYGVGASGAVATDAHYRLLRLGLNAVAYTDTHMQVWSTTTLGPSDVVVAVSHSGHTRETIEALSLAKANGAKTIALTSHVHSPLGKLADICLVSVYEATASDEGSVLARTSQLAIIDALAEEVAASQNVEMLERARTANEALRTRKRVRPSDVGSDGGT
jgi:RpiR family carbohydrate utilization transcriptional regulator